MSASLWPVIRHLARVNTLALWGAKSSGGRGGGVRTGSGDAGAIVRMRYNIADSVLDTWWEAVRSADVARRFFIHHARVAQAWSQSGGLRSPLHSRSGTYDNQKRRTYSRGYARTVLDVPHAYSSGSTSHTSFACSRRRYVTRALDYAVRMRVAAVLANLSRCHVDLGDLRRSLPKRSAP